MPASVDRAVRGITAYDYAFPDPPISVMSPALTPKLSHAKQGPTNYCLHQRFRWKARYARPCGVNIFDFNGSFHLATYVSSNSLTACWTVRDFVGFLFLKAPREPLTLPRSELSPPNRNWSNSRSCSPSDFWFARAEGSSCMKRTRNVCPPINDATTTLPSFCV